MSADLDLEEMSQSYNLTRFHFYKLEVTALLPGHYTIPGPCPEIQKRPTFRHGDIQSIDQLSVHQITMPWKTES